MKTPAKQNTIQCIQTVKDSGERLRLASPLAFSRARADAGTTVRVDHTRTFQEMVGFGGAFTEAAAHTLSRMSPAKREEALKAYFDPATGSRYSLCRTHINSCDFALGNYAYNDTPGDYELRQFDISRDRKLLLPMIMDALHISGRGFHLLASPWSPPAWMKTTGQMNNGGSLKVDCRDAWALYVAKYIKAYRDAGLSIWGVTVQNEPAAVQTWDSCIYTAEEERDFVKFHLGPRLEKEGLSDTRIVIWDHNKDLIVERAGTVLSDPEAARYVWGTGFHWYSGDHFESLAEVHRRFPDKHLLFTEGCQEGGVKLGSWELGEKYAHAIIGDVNNWTAGWIDWNMVLDIQGGPNHVGNYCDAPILADPETDVLHYQSAYYYLGHFSRYVEPGALRIGVTASDAGLESTGFKNPDGSIVVVVLNLGDEEHAYSLTDGDRAASVCIPARAIQTLLFYPALL